MYLSDKQLGDRFAVSRQTVWRWHRVDQTFPRAITLSPGCTRWKLADVENWEAEQANKPGGRYCRAEPEAA